MKYTKKTNQKNQKNKSKTQYGLNDPLKNHKLEHKHRKHFNSNTVKVSYSSKKNMSKIIKGHNKKVTSKPRDQRLKCNCRKNKQNSEWKGNVKLSQDHYQKKRCILDLQGERESTKAIYRTTSYHLNTIFLQNNIFKLHVAFENSFK